MCTFAKILFCFVQLFFSALWKSDLRTGEPYWRIFAKNRCRTYLLTIQVLNYSSCVSEQRKNVPYINCCQSGLRPSCSLSIHENQDHTAFPISTENKLRTFSPNLPRIKQLEAIKVYYYKYCSYETHGWLDDLFLNAWLPQKMSHRGFTQKSLLRLSKPRNGYAKGTVQEAIKRQPTTQRPFSGPGFKTQPQNLVRGQFSDFEPKWLLPRRVLLCFCKCNNLCYFPMSWV